MKAVLDGFSINYEVFGEGEPIICLHGWNEDSSIFKSRVYKNLLKGYKVYSIDLPGFGESDNLERYSFYNLNNMLEQFSRHMNMVSFSMLGQCMGGIIALDYAIRHKEKVRKLILVETMIYFPVWLNLLLIKRLNSWALKLMLKRKLGIKLLSFHRVLRDSSKDKRLVGMLKKADITQSLEYIKLMKKYSRYNHIERSKVLSMPIVIITTDNTFRQVKRTARNLGNVLENARVLNVPGRSHFIYVE